MQVFLLLLLNWTAFTLNEYICRSNIMHVLLFSFTTFPLLQYIIFSISPFSPNATVSFLLPYLTFSACLHYIPFLLFLPTSFLFSPHHTPIFSSLFSFLSESLFFSPYIHTCFSPIIVSTFPLSSSLTSHCSSPPIITPLFI